MQEENCDYDLCLETLQGIKAGKRNITGLEGTPIWVQTSQALELLLSVEKTSRYGLGHGP